VCWWSEHALTGGIKKCQVVLGRCYVLVGRPLQTGDPARHPAEVARHRREDQIARHPREDLVELQVQLGAQRIVAVAYRLFGSGDIRLDKLVQLIKASPRSIHDLSDRAGCH
jgi:hypothetical protein